MRKDDFETGIRDFEKAVQLDPNLTIAKDNLKLASSRKNNTN